MIHIGLLYITKINCFIELKLYRINIKRETYNNPTIGDRPRFISNYLLMKFRSIVFFVLFDFSNYFVPLSKSVTATSLAEAKRQGAVLAWGNFLTIAINFMIVAWVLFLVVKGINRLRLMEALKPADTSAPTTQEKLLMEIRDLIAKK